MKLKIEKRFADKYTKEVYKVGSVKEFTEDRTKELLADKRGLVSVVPEEKFQEPEAKPESKPAKKPRKKSGK